MKNKSLADNKIVEPLGVVYKSDKRPQFWVAMATQLFVCGFINQALPWQTCGTRLDIALNTEWLYFRSNISFMAFFKFLRWKEQHLYFLSRN